MRAPIASVNGDYVTALRQAMRRDHAGWRVVAATACAIEDERVARAAANLHVVARARLHEVCPSDRLHVRTLTPTIDVSDSGDGN